MAIVNFSTNVLGAYGMLWMPLGDGEQQPFLLDLQQIQLSSGLSSIPTATVSVALGREATTQLAANIHFLVNEMKMQLSFQIYMSGFEAAQSFGIEVERWPNEPFLIFEGYTSAFGFTKTSGGRAGFTVSANHWLADLSFSSILSRTVSNLNPAMLAKASSFIAGGAGLLPSFTVHTMAHQFMTEENISNDFWGLSLKPWFLRISEQDLLVDPDDPVLNNPLKRKNTEAIRALNRFEPIAAADGGLAYTYGVPLAITVDDILEHPATIAAIGDEVSLESFESMAGTTLWNKIATDFSAKFSLAVIPLVQSALVVPFCPGIRDVWQTIYAEEYDAISSNESTPRVVRGVRLFGGLGSATGAFGSQRGEAARGWNIGGRYDNPLFRDGEIIYLNAPRWLGNVVSQHHFGRAAVGPRGIVGNAVQPGVGAVPVDDPPGELRRDAESVYNRFARSVYVNAVTRSRSARFSGKLRFDVCPGSSVRIIVNEERFVRDLVNPFHGTTYLYGSVRRVTHMIDAETPGASTVLDVGWLRSEQENADDATSLQEHPLWGTQWLGAPYVERAEFVPQPNLLFGQ